MFKRDERIAREGPNKADSYVNKTLSTKGDIVFGDSLFFDGKHRGNMSTGDGKKGLLVIGKNAKIKGRINVTKIIILGQVEGNIYSNGLITLLPGSRVNGDIYYKDIDMRHGASITGNFRHNGGKIEQEENEHHKQQ